MGTAYSSLSYSSTVYERNSEVIKQLLDIVRSNRNSPNYNLSITLPNGSYFLISSTTLSDCKKLLKALNVKTGNSSELTYATNIMSWGGALAKELEITHISDYINCVKLISYRYAIWEGIFSDDKFRPYVEDIKSLKSHYPSIVNRSLPNFSTPLNAVSHYIKHKGKLNCTSLDEYVNRARKAREYPWKIKRNYNKEDGSVCEVHTSWRTRAVYYDKTRYVTIATYFAKATSTVVLQTIVVVIILVLILYFGSQAMNNEN